MSVASLSATRDFRRFNVSFDHSSIASASLNVSAGEEGNLKELGFESKMRRYA